MSSPNNEFVGGDGGLSSDQEEDYDDRRHRNRERNKEHARKTRVRKKEQLQALKTRVSELEEEGRLLKQSIQECSVASILLGLSSGSAAAAPTSAVGSEAEEGKTDEVLLSSPTTAPSSPRSKFGACLSGGKRKRFLSLDGEDPSPPPMELNIKGQITLVGGPGNEGKANINWKTGVYVDDKGKRQQLTKSELETLRRERNRMHAKMTRDRKKCFIASLRRVISKLEEENQQLRETLDRSRVNERSQTNEEKKPRQESMFSSSFPSGAVYQGNTSTSLFSGNIYTVG